ncbi:MAG: L-lysine 6-transaminase [Thermoanaerobaculia bacterium]|nr:MAG: L-lysine 6-transaminase [Thermoanaerobaculia bacterium]
MTTTLRPSIRVAPGDVRDVLSRHILVDGYHLVQDIQKSHGVWLHDAVRGRDMLDFFGHFSTNPVGFNHPGLASPEFRERILPAALNKPANSDVYTTYMAEFVETFSRVVPERFRRHLFFIEGGAPAIENALKTAFDWKVRRNLAAGRGELGTRIIHLRQAFHGRTGYTLSLTNTADPRKTQYYPRFDWPRVTNPKLRFPVTAEVAAEVEALERQAVAEIEAAVAAHPHDIAALIIEPIQGEGGDNHFRAEFFRALRALADEHDFLLIFDEVQTGFGTTGKWWAFEHFGVEPDIFAFAKKTQVCGIAVNPRVDEVDSVFKVSSRINSTWGGNLVDMVRCQRILEVIEEESLLANCATVGAHLLDGLRRLEAVFPGRVTNARGRGLFVAFDLPDGETRGRALKALNEADVLGLASGERAIRMRPPLVLSKAEADEGLRRIETALARLLG